LRRPSVSTAIAIICRHGDDATAVADL
jgi:hypothetical protein